MDQQIIFEIFICCSYNGLCEHDQNIFKALVCNFLIHDITETLTLLITSCISQTFSHKLCKYEKVILFFQEVL